MKSIPSLLLSSLALGAFSTLALAEDAPRAGGEGRRPGGPDGASRPVPPLIAALDANKDGVIDATEMANASAALKALDKNGDGKLSGDEIHPARGERPPGAPDGARREGARPEGARRDGAKPEGARRDGAPK